MNNLEQLKKDAKILSGMLCTGLRRAFGSDAAMIDRLIAAIESLEAEPVDKSEEKVIIPKQKLSDMHKELVDRANRIAHLESMLEAEPVEGELLPCPFCGSKKIDLSEVRGFVNGDTSRPFIAAGCDNCHASGPDTEFESIPGYEESLAKWNTRPTEQTEQGWISALGSSYAMFENIREALSKADQNCLGSNGNGSGLEWALRDEIIDGISRQIESIDSILPQAPTKEVSE